MVQSCRSCQECDCFAPVSSYCISSRFHMQSNQAVRTHLTGLPLPFCRTSTGSCPYFCTRGSWTSSVTSHRQGAPRPHQPLDVLGSIPLMRSSSSDATGCLERPYLLSMRWFLLCLVICVQCQVPPYSGAGSGLPLPCPSRLVAEQLFYMMGR